MYYKKYSNPLRIIRALFIYDYKQIKITKAGLFHYVDVISKGGTNARRRNENNGSVCEM